MRLNYNSMLVRIIYLAAGAIRASKSLISFSDAIRFSSASLASLITFCLASISLRVFSFLDNLL